MPWRKHLSPEEVGYLESLLRQDLVPVRPDPEFVHRTFGHIQNPREVQVPLKAPRSLHQSLMVLASLSGALLGLAMAVMWLYLRRRSSPGQAST